MAKHMVKCLYCGKMFDRDTEPCVKVSNRYIHQTCFDNKDAATRQDDLDRAEFWEYIK